MNDPYEDDRKVILDTMGALGLTNMNEVPPQDKFDAACVLVNVYCYLMNPAKYTKSSHATDLLWANLYGVS
jgi:hypothetical protein